MSIVWMSGNVCVCMCGCMCACVHVCTYVGVCMGVCALVCGWPVSLLITLPLYTEAVSHLNPEFTHSLSLASQLAVRVSSPSPCLESWHYR